MEISSFKCSLATSASRKSQYMYKIKATLGQKFICQIGSNLKFHP